MIRFSTFAAIVALSSAPMLAGAAAAQGFAAMPQASDADRLSNAMRTIGANPRDVDALITAGELSLRLGDAAGAAALFKRAEQIEPRNGRVRAGMASILVHEERPGEALRYFSQAEGFGLSPERFAAERGLAFDLVGEQDRAQRDYRLALRTGGANDEVIRRYALSLGISGRRDLALEQIDTLLRRSDRGAWRVRAFVLAMNGDVPGAERIATSMMPPGTAGGLAPFFARLAGLGVVDRAFAVHFGETRTTPARLADARMVPQFGVLPPDPYAPRAVQVASAPPVAVAAKPDRRERRRRDRDRNRERGRAVQVATAVSSPAPVLPAPPVYAANVQPLPGSAMIQPLPGVASRLAGTAYAATGRPVTGYPTVQPLPGVPARSAAAASPPAVYAQVAPRQGPALTPAPVVAAPTRLASVQLPAASALPSLGGPMVSRSVTPPAQTPPVPSVAPVPPRQGSALTPALVQLASVQPSVPESVTSAAVRTVTPPPQTSATPVDMRTVPPRPVESATVLAAAALPVMRQPGSVIAPPAPGALAQNGADTMAVSATAAPSAAAGFGSMVSASPVAPATTAAAPLPPPPRSDNDSILARIIANISVPGAELGVAPVRPEPVVAAASAPVVTRADPVEIAAEPAKPVARKPVTAAPAKPDPKLAAATRAAERKAAKDAAAKKIVDDRALAAKKAAADARVLAAKEAAEEKRIARSQPARIWVQVAGGAAVGDLPKAFAAARTKAPALAGRGAYSTPLRATNRVLTGPFKTDAEARSFVNQLAKQGVSAFAFTSAPGQKITKLPAR